MKTKAIILAALLIALTLPAHAGGIVEMVSGAVGGAGSGGDGEPQTGGKVTVRGLGRYEGKFVMGIADGDPALLAAGGVNSAGAVSAGVVKGGKAVLKVWQGAGGSYGGFDGDGPSLLLLSVYGGQSPIGAVAMGLVEVNFRKGSGSGKGTFIAGDTFDGAIGGIANRAVTNAKVSPARATKADDDSEDSPPGFLSRLFGGREKEEAAPADNGGGFLSRLFGGREKEEAAPAARTSPPGFFSSIGDFFGMLFGGRNLNNASVEELAARARRGDQAAVQALGEMVQAGNQEAFQAMSELVTEMALSGDTVWDDMLDRAMGEGSQQTSSGSARPGPGPQTWAAVTGSPFGSTDIQAIAYGAGKFVAVSDNGKIAYSSDGVSWTLVADSTFGTTDIESIVWGRNKFVAGGWSGKMAYSSDGVTWTRVAASPFKSEEAVYGIAYGGNKFVAVANSYYYNGGRIAYSSDGINWTAVADSTFSRSDINAIAFGNNRFVAVGDNSKVAYSRDGVSWTAVADSAFGDYNLWAVAYGGNRFIAGAEAYSSDGVRWTPLTDDAGLGLFSAIAWGGGRFVAGSSFGEMAYSSDGARWTKVTSSTFGYSDIEAVAFGNNRFVAVGEHGKMAYSTGR